MNSDTNREEFEKIIIKYKFNDQEKAEEIAKFLTRNYNIKISHKEFATLFAMTEKDATIFLNFLQKSLQFQEEEKK